MTTRTSTLSIVLCFAAALRALPVSSAEDAGITLNPSYPKADAIRSIMKRYAGNALPGVALAVHSKEHGWWGHAEGYADLGRKTPMRLDHIHYLQSISKTYMAVAMLLLKEDGKIDFDKPMTQYLPAHVARYIADGDRITVRMLLNHTSGVAEYSNHPEFVARVLLHPLEPFSSEDCLRLLAKERPASEPGKKFAYRNTNYLLLALIADSVTGGHTTFMADRVFAPLGLKDTLYGAPRYLDDPRLVSSYWDVLNTGRPADVTQMQKVNVASLRGDDGIVATPVDAVKFLRGVLEGKLLSPESMAEMTTWVHDGAGNPVYGMGLYRFSQGEIVALGHGGGGIGGGGVLLHVPSKDLYLFLAANIGVLVESDASRQADEMKNAILATLLQ